MRIVPYPHPALRHPSQPVGLVDRDLRLTIGKMFEAMYGARGVGLAAPQVALPIRLVVMNLTGDPNRRDQEEVYINPTLVASSGHVDREEGCLSFPGLFANVRRAEQVTVRAYDLQGHPRLIDATGHAARAWQHEIDHLDGIVFIERFGRLARLLHYRDIKVFENRFRRMQQEGTLPCDADLERMLADLRTALAKSA